jgi:hypothetical protein
MDKIEKYITDKIKYYTSIRSYTDEDYYSNIGKENLCDELLEYITYLKKENNNDTN